MAHWKHVLLALNTHVYIIKSILCVILSMHILTKFKLKLKVMEKELDVQRQLSDSSCWSCCDIEIRSSKKKQSKKKNLMWVDTPQWRWTWVWKKSFDRSLETTSTNEKVFAVWTSSDRYTDLHDIWWRSKDGTNTSLDSECSSVWFETTNAHIIHVHMFPYKNYFPAHYPK